MVVGAQGGYATEHIVRVSSMGPLSHRLAVKLFRAMEGYRNRDWRHVFCNGHGS